MAKRRHRLQDLDQALGVQLAGSTTGRNELRESDLAHPASRVAMLSADHIRERAARSTSRPAAAAGFELKAAGRVG